MRPGIVHRLDRFTSGVLLVAKTDTAHLALAKQFATRTVEKIYLALVEGVMKGSGRITKPITRDPRNRARMTARLPNGPYCADGLGSDRCPVRIHSTPDQDRHWAYPSDSRALGFQWSSRWPATGFTAHAPRHGIGISSTPTD